MINAARFGQRGYPNEDYESLSCSFKTCLQYRESLSSIKYINLVLSPAIVTDKLVV